MAGGALLRLLVAVVLLAQLAVLSQFLIAPSTSVPLGAIRIAILSKQISRQADISKNEESQKLWSNEVEKASQSMVLAQNSILDRNWGVKTKIFL